MTIHRSFNEIEKEWLYEFNIQFREFFGDVKAAHQQQNPSDKASVTVLESKLDFSRIKQKEKKNPNDHGRSEKNLGTEKKTGVGSPKTSKV
jgi:hypothetical protein